MPQKILNGAEISIRIEQLRGHRVPEMVAGNPEFRLMSIILHTLLYAANGDGVSRTDPFFDQKDSVGFGWRPYPEIACQSEEGIIAHIDDPIFGTLPVFDDDLLLLEVQHPQGEMGDFLHAKTTPEHHHEHGPVPMPLHNSKEGIHLFIPQVPRQRLRHLEGMTLPNGIYDG